jgi:hypothetical protein
LVLRQSLHGSKHPAQYELRLKHRAKGRWQVYGYDYASATPHIIGEIEQEYVDTVIRRLTAELEQWRDEDADTMRRRSS